MFPEHMTLDQHCEGDLFDLILTSHQQSFSYVGTGQGFFLVSSGAEIRPLSQWDLGDFFPNLKKKFPISKKKKKKKFFTKLAITHTIAIKLNENRMQF